MFYGSELLHSTASRQLADANAALQVGRKKQQTYGLALWPLAMAGIQHAGKIRYIINST